MQTRPTRPGMVKVYYRAEGSQTPPQRLGPKGVLS